MRSRRRVLSASLSGARAMGWSLCGTANWGNPSAVHLRTSSLEPSQQSRQCARIIAAVVHDTRAGLRINPACEVIDMYGDVIPGLYCGGESAGGFSQHGLARAACQGYIAGRAAAAAPLLEQGILNASPGGKLKVSGVLSAS